MDLLRIYLLRRSTAKKGVAYVTADGPTLALAPGHALLRPPCSPTRRRSARQGSVEGQNVGAATAFWRGKGRAHPHQNLSALYVAPAAPALGGGGARRTSMRVSACRRRASLRRPPRVSRGGTPGAVGDAGGGAG